VSGAGGRSGGATLAGAVLALGGLVLFVVGLQSGPAQLRPGVPDFVNADRPGINAHNSPSVAVGPGGRPSDAVDRATIALADRIDTPRFSCSVSVSTNGGDSWRALTLPLPVEVPNCHQPDVAYGPGGKLLVLYTATGGQFNQPIGVWLQRFAGDTAEGPPTRVASGEAFHARMAVEGSNVWVTWIQAQGAADKPLGFGTTPAPLRLARSTDGGATFPFPVSVSDGRRVVQPTPVSIGGGRLVVGALDLAGDFDDYEARHGGQGGSPSDEGWRVVTWTSVDGGTTFGPPVTVADDLVPPARIIVNLAPAPAFARDPSLDGRVYAAWDAGRGDGRDVFLSRSDDAGATWSTPVAVAPRPRSQFLPAVGVSPEGRVDVVFYDRAADPGDVQAHVTMASSTDAGRTFRTATISDAPFDSRIGFGSLQGIPVLGSRLALHAGTDRSLAFWSDTSRGTIDTNVQDLAAVGVDIEDAGRRRPALMLLGALLLGLGGCLVAVVRLRPGDRRPQEA
jgi:hypothetical protein